MLLHHRPVHGGRSVFIAIPSYGPIPAVTAFSLFESHPKLIEAGYSVELGLLVGNCHVDDARNVLVRDFLKSGCEQMVFIDSDIGWMPSDLIKLLDNTPDIVAATYPKKQNAEEYPCRLFPGEIWSNSEGLIEVDGVPTGFLKIRRNVLERLFAESPQYRPNSQEDTASLIFERDIINGKRMSGDYNFCRKARESGYKVYVNPSIWMEHMGEKSYSGSYGSYLRRNNGLTMKHALGLIREGKETDADIIELVSDWSNDGWAAGHELIKASIQVARQAKGPIIECGSGLTTLVMAATGAEVHSLEHDLGWLNRVQKDLSGDATVYHAPLTQYEKGRWYGDANLPWDKCDIILCDGPPRTISNRKILFDFMAAKHANPRCILVDDAAGQADPCPGFRTEILGELRQFAIGRK